jgi:integrase
MSALTEAKIARAVKAGIPSGKTQAILWADAPKGLGLRIRGGGSASWIYVFRPQGVGRSEPSRKITLGRWPSLSLKQAAVAAVALAGEIALKKDPAADRRVERTREKRVLSKALDSFDVSLRQRKIVNRITMMSTLRRGLAPLLTREIDTLTRKNFVDRIDTLEAAGKPGAAQDLRAVARSMLEWAVTKGLTQYNVLAGLRRPRASRAERLEDERKGRALDDDDIRSLWTAAESLGAFGGLLRLAILTGMRRNELSGLKWSDVHADRIVISAERAKTGVRHEAPLTAAMRAVLSAQPRTTSELVFPGRSSERMKGWTSRVARAMDASGVNFRLHDLRRTVRTLMSRLGVSEETAELSIGHVRRGLVGTYNKDQAWASRADAFERVSAHVAEVVESSAIAPAEEELSAVVSMPAVRPKPDGHRRVDART